MDVDFGNRREFLATAVILIAASAAMAFPLPRRPKTTFGEIKVGDTFFVNNCEYRKTELKWGDGRIIAAFHHPLSPSAWTSNAVIAYDGRRLCWFSDSCVVEK